MTLSKTSEYALRTLAFMAHSMGEKHSCRSLHRELGIPAKYLQRILTLLSKKGIVTSTRGRTGGYVLNAKAARVSLATIIHAIDGFDREPTCIFGFGECPLEQPCVMHAEWARSHEHIVRVLTKTRLVDLVSPKRRA